MDMMQRRSCEQVERDAIRNELGHVENKDVDPRTLCLSKSVY
jgi:hypothetical protein